VAVAKRQHDGCVALALLLLAQSSSATDGLCAPSAPSADGRRATGLGFNTDGLVAAEAAGFERT
jgi:hypothetical protein